MLQPDGRRISQRIRGDSGLRYDDELLRLVDQAREMFQLPVDTVTLTSVPRSLSVENDDYLSAYSERLAANGLSVKRINKIEGYPDQLDTNTIKETLKQHDRLVGIERCLEQANSGRSRNSTGSGAVSAPLRTS